MRLALRLPPGEMAFVLHMSRLATKRLAGRPRPVAFDPADRRGCQGRSPEPSPARFLRNGRSTLKTLHWSVFSWPRGAKTASHPFFSTLFPSSSAICTAFSAAPLRRLSDTTHRFSPLSIVLSCRMREIYVAYSPTHSIGVT